MVESFWAPCNFYKSTALKAISWLPQASVCKIPWHFPLLTPFVQAILSGAENLKVKKPVHVREMGIHLHSTAIMVYPCLCFHFIVDEISRTKTTNCPRRLTAVDTTLGLTFSLGGEDGGFDRWAKMSSYFGGGVQYPLAGVFLLKPTGGNWMSSAGATGGLGFGNVGGGAGKWTIGKTGTW